MTGNRVLLDTNIVIELFKGNTSILFRLGNRLLVDISHVVPGELLPGAYRSSNTPKHIAQIHDFMKRCNILSADVATADTYAQTKANLLKKGKPIPENDIWIAATALQHNLNLVTMDKHFHEVDGLVTENWNLNS